MKVNPEWTHEDFKNALPFSELPKSLQTLLSSKAQARETSVTINLSVDVLQAFQAIGANWQTQLERIERMVSRTYGLKRYPLHTSFVFNKLKPMTKTTQQNPNAVQLPYFDELLGLLDKGNKDVARSFGRHVHWGYWQQPKLATLTTDDFEQATENLSHQVCLAGAIKNDLSVLDVGCGFGGTIAHINEHYTGMNLTGLNLDERQLARAREIVLPLADNRIDFQQGNACELPYPDHSFDVVLAVECIFHFPDREQFFKEAYRVLKPGGYLALSDFVSTQAVIPLAKIKLPEMFSIGFYGRCNMQYSLKQYQQVANKTSFSWRVQRNITANTLPTYSYLRRLTKHQRVANKLALLETAVIEIASRLRLVNYCIYGFQKQD